MKKSVIILIAIIYVSAVAVVSFFGLKPEIVITDTKIAEIVIDEKTNNSGAKVTTVRDDDDGASDGVWQYTVRFSISPDEVTNPSLSILAEPEEVVIGEIVEKEIVDGVKYMEFTVTHTIKETFDVTIRADDGGGASDKVTLRLR
jgi:hypothetical protein